MKKSHCRQIAALLFSAIAASAMAALTQWTTASGGNGHWYEWVATVTSAAENAFVASLSGNGWLGASDAGTEGTWMWMDGPEAGDVFWLGGTASAGGVSVG